MVLLPFQTRYIFADGMGDLSVLSIYAVELLIALGILVAGGALRFDRKLLPIVGASALVTAVTALSAIWASSPLFALHAAMHLLFATMLLALLTDERVDRTFVAQAFVAGLFIPVLFGLIQVVTGVFPASSLLGIAARDAQILGDSVFYLNGERLLRAYGTFPHPNIFGGYLAVALLMLLTRTVQFGKWTGLATAWLALGLVLTVSHGAWLAVAAGLAVFHTSAWVSWRRWLLPIAGAATLVLCSVSIDSVTWSQELPPSIGDRLIFAQRSLFMFVNHPLLGVGAGNYIETLSMGGTLSAWWNYQPVHHVGLLMLAELGIVGMVAIGIGTWRLIRPLFSQTTPAGCALIAGLLILGLVDHYLWTQWGGVVLVAITVLFVLNKKDAPRS